MSAQDRVRETLSLTAPDGTAFSALWVGDDISVSKRVAQFSLPLVDGVSVQDLGLDAFDYPLTFYFDDADHDLTTQNFERAWSQKGNWTVIHPVRGTKKLQPIKLTSQVRPVENVLHTVLTTQWIEPNLTPVSGADPVGNVTAQSAQVCATSATQLAQTTAQTSPDLVTAIANGWQACVGIMKQVAGVPQGYATGIYTEILSITQGTVMDMLSMAGAFQALLQTPGLIAGDASSKVKTWSSMATALVALSPTTSTPADKNTAATVEAAATAVVVAMAIDLTTATFTTRPQVIKAINDTWTLFKRITTTLDGVQALFASQSIKAQYFSQGQSYADLMRLVAYLCRYLLGLSFSLKAARTYTLTVPRSPLEVAISEYGKNGWDDSYYDFFLQTNGITGEKMWLLPAGFQVTIYG